MASLLIAAGVLKTYDKIATSRQNRRALKESHHATRLAELEEAHSVEQTRCNTQPSIAPPPYTEFPTQPQLRGAEMRSDNPFRDAVAMERRRSSESESNESEGGNESEWRNEDRLHEMDGVVLADGDGSGKGKRKGLREKFLGRKRKGDAVTG